MIEDVTIAFYTFLTAICVWRFIGARLHALQFVETISPYSEYIFSLHGKSLASYA